MKSHHEIATTVERILQSDTLVVQSEQEAFIANIAFKTGTGSFSDALIGALGFSEGGSHEHSVKLPRALVVPGSSDSGVVDSSR